MPNETITAPAGFRANGVAAGIKASKALDVAVLVADAPADAAAVFTQNRFCGAPIVVGRQHMKGGRLRAIVVNSGCSNVATGARGVADARTMCRQVADSLDAPVTQVLPASTGVIGEFLPMDKLRTGIASAIDSLSPSVAAGRRFARAILTTDLKMKQACRRVRIGRTAVTIAGCCKGSGMIAPRMATMLGYLTTDAGLARNALARLLREAVEATFNRVTVDECQSTSDMVAIMASNRAGRVDTQKHLASFAAALHDVCESLAYQIAADGEGATRVLEVIVTGARSAGDAHAAARAIAVSPLVKTAAHGADPNWGRIVQALGQTTVRYAPDRVVVRIGRIVLFRRNAPVRNLDRTAVVRLMRQKHVTVAVDLGAGNARDRVLTCDLSRDYITINADYHT